MKLSVCDTRSSENPYVTRSKRPRSKANVQERIVLGRKEVLPYSVHVITTLALPHIDDARQNLPCSDQQYAPRPPPLPYLLKDGRFIRGKKRILPQCTVSNNPSFQGYLAQSKRSASFLPVHTDRLNAPKHLAMSERSTTFSSFACQYGNHGPISCCSLP